MPTLARSSWLDGRALRQSHELVDDHQRPNTEAENEEIVREKLAELRGEQPDSEG
jgi:hypothetical protein